MADIRTVMARAARRVLNWDSTPRWAANPLRWVAHQFRPHSLTCRFCGATFVASDWRSVGHAGRAYDHYVTRHSGDLYKRYLGSSEESREEHE